MEMTTKNTAGSVLSHHADVKNLKQFSQKAFRKTQAAIFAFSFVFMVTAEAGEVLRLKAGDVSTAGTQSRLLPEVLRSESTSYYVIQFKNAITPQDREALVQAGMVIVRYLPEDAFIVKAKGSTLSDVRSSLESIHTIVAYSPEWKQSPEFVPASVFSAQLRQDVLVLLFPGESLKNALMAINSISSAEVLHSAGRSLTVRVDRQEVGKVAAVVGVEWIQPSPRIETLYMKGVTDQGAVASSFDTRNNYENLTGYESGTKLMGFDTAWARGYTGRGQIASMADTGLDVGDIANLHQDFKGRVPTGYAFGLFSKSWEDPMGHGTHVAGSVMGGGIASRNGLLRGGAYHASLIAESMWSPMLDNLSVPSRLSDLFSKAYADGARIHTNSWGAAASTDYDALSQQVDEYAAANRDMLILFAAGNSGVDRDRDGRVDPGSVSSPGVAKNVLTVGASKNYVLIGGLQAKLKDTRLKDQWPMEPLASSSFSENPQGLAAFSSRGPTKDGRLKPEVVAPGTNILSVRSQHPKAEPLWGNYNQDYVWSGGTSMSTPLTAGAATIVRQYLIEGRGAKTPSASLVKAVLMHTAFDLYPGGFGAVGASRGQELLRVRPDSDQGYGRVDVARATDLSAALLVDEKAGLGTGEKHTFPVRIVNTGRLTITLVYTDAAAATSASKALVNDLDLVLIDSTGREVGLNDRTNNSEMIEVQVTAGEYQVQVRGHNVPQGLVGYRQPYALVVSAN